MTSEEHGRCNARLEDLLDKAAEAEANGDIAQAEAFLAQALEAEAQRTGAGGHAEPNARDTGPLS